MVRSSPPSVRHLKRGVIICLDRGRINRSFSVRTTLHLRFQETSYFTCRKSRVSSATNNLREYRRLLAYFGKFPIITVSWKSIRFLNREHSRAAGISKLIPTETGQRPLLSNEARALSHFLSVLNILRCLQFCIPVVFRFTHQFLKHHPS